MTLIADNMLVLNDGWMYHSWFTLTAGDTLSTLFHLVQELYSADHKNKKNNGKSSTGNKLIGVDDFIGQVLYALFFMHVHKAKV